MNSACEGIVCVCVVVKSGVPPARRKMPHPFVSCQDDTRCSNMLHDVS